MMWDHVMLSRLQFAFTIMYHMLFPVLTIGLSIFLIVMEALWLKTGDKTYYCHCRFWGSLFLLNFAMGVVTGVVMEFQFGTNWSVFSLKMGDFFGNMIGFEAAMAFAVEAAFLAIMMFGWNRVSPGVHLCATAIVASGAVVSAFWIMDSNSWMQTPAGTVMQDDRVLVTRYTAAIFNPSMAVSFFHMLSACLEVGVFVVGGLSAWYLLTNRHAAFFAKSFKMAVVAAIVCTPLQVYFGDASARMIARCQPAKAAGMEALWETNPPGQGAPFAVVAWPDPARERNAFAIEVPALLSFLSTHTFTGKVIGLRDFPPQDRPPIVLPFYTFRLMVVVGMMLFLLMLWTLWMWYRGQLDAEGARSRKWLLWSWILSVPCTYAAMEAGWVAREVGRQPWLVYGMMRTSEGASPLSPAPVLGSLAAYVIVYAALFVLFLLFAARIIAKGPDMDRALPCPPARVPGRQTGGGANKEEPSAPEGP